MVSHETSGWWKGTANPFPRSAVAVRSGQGPAAPTIQTDAVKEVRRVIDEYVTQTLELRTRSLGGDLLPDDGRVIVIHGEFGTGKTHLVIDALERLARARERGLDPRFFYKVPVGGNFLTLYKDIMNDVGAFRMRKRVLEFYADVVKEEIEGHPFADLLVSQLESDKTNAQLVISKYGLREGALLARLRQRLGSVTDDDMYAQALMLLLQPELQEPVWRWFTGEIPGRMLRANGLTEAIDSDQRALEALGVVARVYRRNGRRFVLAIDEMEKLVLAGVLHDKGKIQAFQKLLEIFRRTGGLLIVAGLPDVLDIIPPGRGRVEDEVVPSRLNDEDVRWYIRESIETKFKGRGRGPFSDRGVACVSYLSNGLAREVVRLCYYSYQSASESGGPIDESTVQSVSAARSRMDVGDRVRQRVRDVLYREGYDPHEGWIFAGDIEAAVDFWIPVDGQDIGCAVLINDSILDETQADAVAGLISEVQPPGSRRGIVQVVSGNLPADLRLKLERALGTSPLIRYNQQSFDRDFARALQAVVDNVSVAETDQYPGSAEVRLLRQQTGRIARQQSTMLRLLEGRADREEQLLGTVERAVAESSDEPGTRPETGIPGADTAPDLPPELAELFRRAELTLAGYGDVREIIKRAFDVGGGEPGATLALAARFREGSALAAIGVVTFLAAVLDGFRASVHGWLEALDPEPGRGGEPTDSDLEQLSGICGTYQDLYSAAPLYQLDQLAALTGPAAGDGPDTSSDAIRRSERTRLSDALHEAFDRLGDRIYEAAVRNAGGERATGQAGTLRARSLPANQDARSL